MSSMGGGGSKSEEASDGTGRTAGNRDELKYFHVLYDNCYGKYIISTRLIIDFDYTLLVLVIMPSMHADAHNCDAYERPPAKYAHAC